MYMMEIYEIRHFSTLNEFTVQDGMLFSIVLYALNIRMRMHRAVSYYCAVLHVWAGCKSSFIAGRS